MTDLLETWQPIPGYEKYQISTYGNVIGAYGKPLSQNSFNSNGYKIVHLHKDGKGKVFTIHNLVLRTFVGPRPKGMTHTRHLDGNRLNNRLDNLAYGTAAENGADRVSHGTQTRGRQIAAAKLTDAVVMAIRTEYAAGGVSMRALGAKYGVSGNVIWHIVNRKTWTHI